MTAVVEAKSIRRKFATDSPPVLDGVDLRVDASEFVAIVGPSGCGKSTLLGVIGTLDTRFEGQLSLFGVSVANRSDRQLAQLRGARLGFVFQSYFLVDQLSAIDNVLLPSLFAPEPVTQQRALEALDRVRLADRAADPTGRLSGGQRQRVAIARALAHRPDLVLCDEPTGNLDHDTASQIIDLFKDIHQQGTTLICATHESALAEVATKRYRMNAGQLRDEGERA